MRKYSSDAAFKKLKITFWVVEILQCLLAIIILGITATASQGFTNDLKALRIPGKLGYNIFVAAILMILYFVIIPLDIWRPRFWVTWNKIWYPWPRVILNVFLMALSVGAVASAFYTCSDLCGVVSSDVVFVRYATLCCTCPSATENDCTFSGPEYGVEQRRYDYEAAQGTDIVLMLLFLLSTFILVTFYWVEPTSEFAAPSEYSYGYSGSQSPERSNRSSQAFATVHSRDGV